VLEVGCGDSNIVSLLWVLVGSKSVVSIDAFNYLKKDELCSLFKKSSDLLIHRNFCQSNINPRLNLDVYENLWKVLPSKDILINRQKLIFDEIKNYINGNDSNLFSYDPSYTINKVFPFKFDFIFSQAVFEHVENPKEVLTFLHNNLTENGIVYTDVDFKSHGVSTLYNGHYILNESQYKSISSPFIFRYINRLPPSWFREVFESSFNLIQEDKIILNNNIKLNEVKLNNFIESDLEIGSSLFISSK
jgi:SAM-dependent methyltransferase